MHARTFIPCLLLAVFLMSPLASANHERTHAIRYEAGQNLCTPPQEGDWEIPRGVVVVCAAQDVVVPGHIFLDVGAELHVVDGTDLTFAGSGNHMIQSLRSDSHLGPGTGFFVDGNARIKAVDDATWSLHAGAETRTIIQNSELTGYNELIAGPLSTPESSFRLHDTHLTNGGKVLVLASREANVSITNNLIVGAIDAVTLHGGSAMVKNNTITGCMRGIILTDNAAPQIKGNTISTCTQPFMQDPSPGACSISAILQGNDFTATTTPAVGCMEASGNYWGPLGPNVEGLSVDAWSQRPLHPDRLPRLEVTWTGDETNHNIILDASQSLPSKLHDSPLTFTWSFGDGTTAEGDVVNHQYYTRGEHQIRLLVQDEIGLAQEWIQSVYVGNPSDAGGESLALQSLPVAQEDRSSPGAGFGASLLALVGLAAMVARRRC